MALGTLAARATAVQSRTAVSWQSAGLRTAPAPRPSPRRRVKAEAPPATETAAAAPPLASAGSSGTVTGAGAQGDAEEVAVVIVDHGSRKAESNAMLDEFAALFKSVTGRRVVEPAHMEIAEPTIQQAVARCAAAGARRIVVAPYFLSRGRHIQEDIPALVAEAQRQHPGVECVVAEPIGIDALMAQLIEQRVRAAAGAAAAAP
eukprot:scaffold11.g3898.t1